jgi:hypothetical protein
LASMRGRSTATVALALVLAACGATPGASTGTTSAPAPTATAAASTTGPTTVASGGFEPGSIVVTIVDGVRVRSRPEVSEESGLLEPLLPRGTRLFVLEEPIQASGYDWYHVTPISLAQGRPEGWVAKGSRDGIPWLEIGSVTCPAAPTTATGLSALTPGQRLACFARHSITVRGKFVNCECGEIDGPPMNPSWFGVSESRFLVDPARTRAVADPSDALWAVIDPAGTHPDPIPIGRVLDVTGMFDHPAAASCGMIDGATTERTPACRYDFAVTLIVPAR